jgi:hypothetical protein
MELKEYAIIAQSAGAQASTIVAAMVNVGLVDSTASAENALDFLQDTIAKRALKFTQDASEAYGVAAPAPRGGGGFVKKAPAASGGADPNRPASEKSINFAVTLGADRTALVGKTQSEVSALIDSLK